MKYFLSLFLIFYLLTKKVHSQQRLVVSEDGHTFEYENGASFFWLADTAWELFQRLSKQEIDYYLETRKAQGYNVIQAVILSELGGLITPNRFGELPLIDKNPENPNGVYFKTIDYTIKKAASLDMYIALLPTWGRYWSEEPIFTPENAFSYGKYVGKKYKDQWNIIWILGGDRIPKTEEQYEIIKQMALGLKEGDGTHLITFHPTGSNTSLSFFQNEDWIDFHMAQSGHGTRDNPNYLYPLNNYSAKPTKPFIDGEPRYEDLPVKFWEIKLKEGYSENPYPVADSLTPYGYFNAYDVRRAAYWSVFSGAAGFTYGNGSVWYFWQKGRYAPIAVKHSWKIAMHSKGGKQMQYLKKLIDLYGISNLIPNRSVIANNWSSPSNYQTVLFSKDEHTAFVYSPDGKPIRISKLKFKNKPLHFNWYNPRNGEFSHNKLITSKSILLNFTPPSHGNGNDWVLIISTKKKNI